MPGGARRPAPAPAPGPVPARHASPEQAPAAAPRYPRVDYFEEPGVDRLSPAYYEEADDYEDVYTEYDEYADDADETAAAVPVAGRRRRSPGGRGPSGMGPGGRRFLGVLVALTVLVVLAGVAWFGAREVLGLNYADYDGPGEADVVVEVADGDTTTAIAQRLAESDVVASSKAFLEAAKDNDKVRGIRPGYYQVKTKMSGTDAVEALVVAETRVGEVQIRAGSQLDDVRLPDGKTADGLLAKLAKASCADLNGKSTCVPVAQLRSVAAEEDLRALGVPEWLAAPASKAEPQRRIEGLVLPGIYDLKPGWDARTILKAVLTASAARMEATGLPGGAEATGQDPYQVLIIGSIIEREGVEIDFPKVSRVIYNRLAKNMRLEMDSTINYVLDRPEVRTKSTDRQRGGAYNTYRNTGLPPTPISSPSPEALQAAQSPGAGSWLFFVKCEKNGLSCFADTLDQHQQNIREAQARGAY